MSGEAPLPITLLLEVSCGVPNSTNQEIRVSGLVVKSIVAIDGPRVRFAADAEQFEIFGIYFLLFFPSPVYSQDFIILVLLIPYLAPFLYSLYGRPAFLPSRSI